MAKHCGCCEAPPFPRTPTGGVKKKIHLANEVCKGDGHFIKKGVHFIKEVGTLFKLTSGPAGEILDD